MNINFYPENNNLKFEKAAKEYAKIWDEEGKKITRVLEKISKLKFKEKIINSIINNEISYSSPLTLQANISNYQKKLAIVHELCHRLFIGNDIKIKNLIKENYNLEVHKPVDLILYDALIELYGEKSAKNNVKHEVSLWTGKDISPYKIAWDWALKMTEEERAKEFKKYFKS